MWYLKLVIGDLLEEDLIYDILVFEGFILRW